MVPFSIFTTFHCGAGGLHLSRKSSKVVFQVVGFAINLVTDAVECRAGDVPVLQLHRHGVAQQSQAASRPQHPVGLQEELLVVEPVSRRHGRQKVHLAGSKRQLLRRTLPGSEAERMVEVKRGHLLCCSLQKL